MNIAKGKNFRVGIIFLNNSINSYNPLLVFSQSNKRCIYEKRKLIIFYVKLLKNLFLKFFLKAKKH